MFRKQILALAIIVGLILLNHWLFATLLNLDYLAWYIENGVFISLGSSFIALASDDFKKNARVISTDPLSYGIANLQYLALAGYSLGTAIREEFYWVELDADAPPQENKKRSSETEATSAQGCFSLLLSTLWGLVDMTLTLGWLFILVIVLTMWVLLVVPPQYFVHLLCGAVARRFALSEQCAIFLDGPYAYEIGVIRKSEPTPPGWRRADIGSEPVAFTGLLSVLFFFVLSAWLS